MPRAAPTASERRDDSAIATDIAAVARDINDPVDSVRAAAAVLAVAVAVDVAVAVEADAAQAVAVAREEALAGAAATVVTRRLIASN